MRIGSLFSGFGGLDMAVREVLGGDLAFVSDIGDGPCRILAHRHPEVPNLGDISAVDWSTVGPVNVLTGGFPCQDVSTAGARAGLVRGETRSGLWAEFARAIDALRPSLVVIENVRGLLSARADSAVEPCPWCLGDDGDQPAMRALGAVLADLADLGYDAAWCGLRAADVGAPHGRYRIFVLAWPADAESDTRRILDRDAGAAAHGHHGRRAEQLPGRPGQEQPGAADAAAPALLRTPTAQLAVNGGSQHPAKRRADGHGPTLADEIEHLLPTPAVNDMGAGKSVEAWDEVALMPTPRATDGTKGGPGQRGSSGDLMLPSAVALLPTPRASDGPDGTSHGRTWSTTDRSLHTAAHLHQFGDYPQAVARWEHLTRPAPDPTEPTGKDGAHRLAPAFVEWMMGLPAGHVTDPAIWAETKPSTARNAQLKALGNGVVPQQAVAGIRHLAAVVRRVIASEAAA